MKLIKINDFIATYFADGSVSAKTVRNWIVEGVVKGTVIGRNYYVDVEGYELTGQQMPFKAGRLYKPEQIRQVLQLSRQSVWRILKDSGLPAVQKGGRNTKQYEGDALNQLMRELVK